MDFLASLFVQKPLHIVLVALVFLAGHLVLRFTAKGPRRHPRARLVPAAAWLLYAAWEWLLMVRSPEANIRVDLLILWPVLAVLSIAFVIRALR